jgi:integrase/recombinase XerD
LLLRFAYQDFLADRELNNSSEANIKNYRMLLGTFVDYCLEQGIENVEDITSGLIKQYFIVCKKRGNNAGTINTVLLRIRAFLNYCVEEKILSENVAHRVKRLKEDVKIDVFTDEQINQMLAYYRSLRRREKSYFAYRGYMLILILLGTGLRRTEVINMKWSHVDEANLMIKVYNSKSRVDSTVFITEKLLKELLYYKSFCKNHFSELSEYVFVNRDNTQMTQNSIMLLFQNLSKKMNFKDVRVSAHTFRHTYCHRLAMSGASPFAIQKLMRHTNIQTTMRYVAMWGNDLREQSDAHNPLNKFEL